jgi:hypothetical protein
VPEVNRVLKYISPFAKHTTDTVTRADGATAKRTTTRALTAVDAAIRLQREIDRLGGRDGILSTNLRTRIDGVPTAKQVEPFDPGAAVYFTLNKKPMCLACDKWDRVADNVAALAQHIDALRRIDRYGVGSLEQAFAGYMALPPMSVDWWTVLGVDANATLEQVDEAFKRQAFIAHPDRGGTHDEMARLSEARQAAHRALKAVH